MTYLAARAMRPLTLTCWCALAVVAAACSPSPPAPVAPAQPSRPLAAMRIGSQDEARAVLGRSDGFTQRMSPADRSFRIMQPLPVTEAALLAHLAAQAQSFTPEEQVRLERARAALEAGLTRRGLSLAPFLPPEVLLLKASAENEFGMPYTRQNAIILPASALAHMDDALLELVVAHELWHVVSRHSAALRAAAYAIIGTTTAPGFTMPAEVAERYITNPDGPDVEFRMPVQDGGRTAWVMALLSFKSPGFTPGGGLNFMELIEVRFLELASNASGKWQPARDAAGALIFHPPTMALLASCYGGNTDEIVHPDEIIAQSFALMLVSGTQKIKTPALLDDIAAVIRDGAAHPPEVRCRY
jgi:hypothetical protein